MRPVIKKRILIFFLSIMAPLLVNRCSFNSFVSENQCFVIIRMRRCATGWRIRWRRRVWARWRYRRAWQTRRPLSCKAPTACRPPCSATWRRRWAINRSIDQLIKEFLLYFIFIWLYPTVQQLCPGFILVRGIVYVCGRTIDTCCLAAVLWLDRDETILLGRDCDSPTF